MAFAARDQRQSHAFGTAVSIGMHVLIGGVLLIVATQSPRSAGPNVSIALLAPNLARTGPPGSSGGSGMEAAAERTRTPAPPKREFSAADAPPDVVPIAAAVPALIVDPPHLLPGSAVALDSGRGSGPGAGSERGSGFSGAGPGSGPGRDIGLGGDGFGPGGGATSPQLIREVKPTYTIEAMRAKVQGQVELEVIVLPDGTVDPARVRITRSLDRTFGLDAQAIEAVKQWRFRPGKQNDRAVSVPVRVELTFTLR
jgi:protein TonB